jgi:hypothetical protein
MDVDAFLEKVSAAGLRLPRASADVVPGHSPETIDALFHKPLLALAAMVIARNAPFPTIILGRSVAMLLAEHFTALRHSAHVLEMSFTLRRRCAEALAFLESARLVAISEDRQRIVSLTHAGKAHIDSSGRDASDLGLLIRQLRITQERVRARVGNDEH